MLDYSLCYKSHHVKFWNVLCLLFVVDLFTQYSVYAAFQCLFTSILCHITFSVKVLCVLPRVFNLLHFNQVVVNRSNTLNAFFLSIKMIL